MAQSNRRHSTSGLAVRVLGREFRVLTAGSSLRIAQTERDPEEMLRHTHTHFTYEVLFAVDGELTLATEDFIRSYRDEVVIVPPGIKHCSGPRAEGCYCLLVLPEEDGSLLPVASGEPLSIGMSEDVAFYIRRLAQVWGIDGEERLHLVAQLLHRVFGALAGMGKDAHPAPSERAPIGVIEAYVNSHYSQPITLKILSEVVHLCEKQVARIIKREYGVTLAQLLAQKRVGAAEMLLKNSDLPVSEIAERVSPTAENYFYTQFRELRGMTPLQYRKAYRRAK